jgi:hypothetical protein
MRAVATQSSGFANTSYTKKAKSVGHYPLLTRAIYHVKVKATDEKKAAPQESEGSGPY